MQPKSSALSIVAREIALVIASGAYPPDFAEHIPGITNKVADELSRFTELGSSFVLLDCLNDAKYIKPHIRDDSWWKTKRADS